MKSPDNSDRIRPWQLITFCSFISQMMNISLIIFLLISCVGSLSFYRLLWFRYNFPVRLGFLCKVRHVITNNKSVTDSPSLQCAPVVHYKSKQVRTYVINNCKWRAILILSIFCVLLLKLVNCGWHHFTGWLLLICENWNLYLWKLLHSKTVQLVWTKISNSKYLSSTLNLKVNLKSVKLPQTYAFRTDYKWLTHVVNSSGNRSGAVVVVVTATLVTFIGGWSSPEDSPEPDPENSPEDSPEDSSEPNAEDAKFS